MRIKGNRMCLLLAVVAMTVPCLKGAPATKFFGGNVPISIKLPDSDELVKTDVPSQSAIPECLKSLDGVTENEDGLVVPAEAFTQCARKELGRLQSELKPSEAEADESSEEEPVEDDLPSPPPAKSVEPKKDEPAPPPKEEKPYFPEAPTIPDLTSITDAFTHAKPIDKNPTVLGEVVKILQVIFDFRRVMSDMQRILHGDLHGVLREYPERARGFFQMVSSLPSRFSHARDKVEEVKEESKDPEYVTTLEELHNYLTSAGASSQELPNALSLVSTMDALRSIAGRLQNHLSEGLAGRKRATKESLTQRSQPQSRVLDDIKDIFLIIPDTFRAYGRRSKLNGGPGIFSPSPVSPLSPWNPLNPLSPISPLSAVSRLTPADPLGPVSRAQVGAVDAISKRLVDLFGSRNGNKRQ